MPTTRGAFTTRTLLCVPAPANQTCQTPPAIVGGAVAWTIWSLWICVAQGVGAPKVPSALLRRT